MWLTLLKDLDHDVSSISMAWYSQVDLLTQVMGPADFVRLLEAVLIVSGRCLGHAARVRDLMLDFLGSTKAPRMLQTEAASGCTDAITAVSEAAHACWIRLLNARHAPAALPLQFTSTKHLLCMGFSTGCCASRFTESSHNA